MEDIVPILLFGGIAGLVVFGTFAHYQRAYKMLSDWTRSRGLVLRSAERRSFFTGPFFFRTWKGDVVYHFSAEDTRTGKLRSGYARCRTGWFMSSVDVVFD
jgi:hypothetical protein